MKLNQNLDLLATVEATSPMALRGCDGEGSGSGDVLANGNQAKSIRSDLRPQPLAAPAH